MKKKQSRLSTRFGPETRFEVKPVPPAPFRRLQENRFEELKLKLLAERLGTEWESGQTAQVRWAANEAAALAWVTPYPLLVFPVLFDEKTQVARAQAQKQESVRQRSRELVLAA